MKIRGSWVKFCGWDRKGLDNSGESFVVRADKMPCLVWVCFGGGWFGRVQLGCACAADGVDSAAKRLALSSPGDDL